jgi:plasminogen activator inhibitor 1 RNA-binding protein
MRILTITCSRSSRGGRGGDGERGGRGGRGRGGRDGPRTGGGTNTHGREKKEYDRSESRTGRDRGAKKEGSGRGNWGTDDAEAKNGVRRRKEEVEAAAAEVPVVEEVVEEAAPVVEEAPVRPPKEEEEPDNSVTYEDYLKSKVRHSNLTRF